MARRAHLESESAVILEVFVEPGEQLLPVAEPMTRFARVHEAVRLVLENTQASVDAKVLQRGKQLEALRQTTLITLVRVKEQGGGLHPRRITHRRMKPPLVYVVPEFNCQVVCIPVIANLARSEEHRS